MEEKSNDFVPCSTVAVEFPKIIFTEKGRDFGMAFYTTDIKEQALRWAKRKQELAKRYGENVPAVLNVYEWNERTDIFSVARYDEPSLEWLELIIKCRQNPKYFHGYDIVIGKVADDNVGETVGYVQRGIMRKEDAIERLKFEKINNQIAFCIKKSLDSLCFKEFMYL